MINFDNQFSNIFQKYNKIEKSLNNMENIQILKFIKLNKVC